MGLLTNDKEIDNMIESLVLLDKLQHNLANFVSCDYLKNLASYSLYNLCDSGLKNYFYSHFGLLISFLGLIIQFFGNYYGDLLLEIKFSEVFFV